MKASIIKKFNEQYILNETSSASGNRYVAVRISPADIPPIDLIALKPDEITVEQTTALPLVLATAWEGLACRAGIRQGHKVLIHGGAGVIGDLAIQIALASGAEVFVTCRPDQAAPLKACGAKPIDYTSVSVLEYIAKYTGGKGFDIVFDTIGGTTLSNSLRSVRQHTGHVISILAWGTQGMAYRSFSGNATTGKQTVFLLVGEEQGIPQNTIISEAKKLAEAGELPQRRNAPFVPALIDFDTNVDLNSIRHYN